MKAGSVRLMDSKDTKLTFFENKIKTLIGMLSSNS
jgi:hypothetical protein